VHPHTFYASLFDHEKRDEIFVIMSFAPEFDERWCRVIAPAIQDDLRLTPVRVDERESGESVVHDILDGIVHSKLVLADITCSFLIDDAGERYPVRNGNVMWELGIAHVTRLPDEVIVVRSDNEESLFDLTQFRAFLYDPANVSAGRRTITSLARDRLRTIDQSKADYVKRCANMLDFGCFMVLFSATGEAGMTPPVIRNMGQALSSLGITSAVARLLEMGALTTSYLKVTPEVIARFKADDPSEKMLTYRLTTFGEALLDHLAERTGIMDPRLRPIMESLSRNDPPDGVTMTFP
jgi:hypothetical protein